MKTIAQAQDIVAELESRYFHIPDEELLAYRSSSPEASWKPDRRVHQEEVRVDSSLAPIPERESIEIKKQKIRDSLKVMKEKKKTRDAANSKRIILQHCHVVVLTKVMAYHTFLKIRLKVHALLKILIYNFF
jgi:hypothetical protein